MHKPDFELGQTVHVKRLVVAIARDDVDTSPTHPASRIEELLPHPWTPPLMERLAGRPA